MIARLALIMKSTNLQSFHVCKTKTKIIFDERDESKETSPNPQGSVFLYGIVNNYAYHKGKKPYSTKGPNSGAGKFLTLAPLVENDFCFRLANMFRQQILAFQL